jgi:hypothetical protein
MGMDAYIVKYERSGIPRNYKFFEQVLEHFRNDDGMIFIDREARKEYLEERPHIKERFPEENAVVTELVSGEDGYVELSIG